MKQRYRQVPLELLHKCFTYEAESGRLLWRVRASGSRNAAGQEAGWTAPDGYRRVSIGGTQVLAHRVVWALCHGEWPLSGLDHVDGNRLNNRERNLRLASQSENMANRGRTRNNKAGFKGVCYDPVHGRHLAQINFKGQHEFLGYHDTAELAAKAYREACIRLHGAFARFEVTTAEGPTTAVQDGSKVGDL